MATPVKHPGTPPPLFVAHWVPLWIVGLIVLTVFGFGKHFLFFSPRYCLGLHMCLENKHTPSFRLFFILSSAAYVFCLFVFKFSTRHWFTLIWNAQMEDCMGFPPLLSYLKAFDSVWRKQLGLQSSIWLNRISLKNNVSDIEIRETHKTKPTKAMICGGRTSKDPGPLPHLPVRYPNHKLLWWRGSEKKGVKYSTLSTAHFPWLLQFKTGITCNILIRDSHV